MSTRAARIDEVAARVCRFPTEGGGESDGTIDWDSTTVLIVQVSSRQAGATGLGYAYTHAAAAGIVETLLREVVCGRCIDEPDTLMLAMAHAARNIGCTGVVSSAIAAVDMAIWDLHATSRQVPLVELLGQQQDYIEAYESSGFIAWSDERLTERWQHSRMAGMRSFKMKVGRDIDRDIERVMIARRVIGDEAELFVDANGAWSADEAIDHARRLDEAAHVTWLEEPVSSDDLPAMRDVRQAMPDHVRVAAGEYLWAPWQLPALLASQAVDVVQVDATRCLGISGFMRCARQCERAGQRLSAHTAPSLHVHLCCATSAACNTEWFFDHVRIEHQLFEGAAHVENGGRLYPQTRVPGHGLRMRAAIAEQHAVNLHIHDEVTHVN